jgi:LPS-assembly protein
MPVAYSFLLILQGRCVKFFFKAIDTMEKKRIFSFFIFFIIIPLLIGNILFSSEAGFYSEDLNIIARYQQKTNNRILATGNVEVHYRNIKLFADRIELNTETRDVYAEGNVSIHFPEEVIDCERIHFNLDSSRGELKKVYGRIQPSVFYEADSIERKDANLYKLRKAKITSCTQAVPRWKFSCAEAKFKKDDYIEMKHSVLSIKKIPIFYFPYLRYPLNRERATGFLMPQFGYSGVKGLFYSQGFYLALKRNMDATFNFDYYSGRGFGGGLQYRYLFSSGTGGDLSAYIFKFKEDPEREDLDKAYIIRFNHNQPLFLDFSLIANVDYQSSFDFLKEFDNNFKRAVVSNRASVVYLSRSWSSWNLSARVSRFETYFAEANTSSIKHNLPYIALNISQMKIFSPLYFSLSSVFDRWEFGWDYEYRASTQRRSQSLSLRPELTFPFTTIPWITLSSTFVANFNYYFKSFEPGSVRSPGYGNLIDEPILSTNYLINMELTGPVFNKVFFRADGSPKLKHIIEPNISYIYDSPVSASDRIITLTGYFFRYHQLTYSLTNRFLIKQDDMTREVFTLGLSQTFYLAPEESPLQMYKDFFEGDIPRFSDIEGYVRFYPSHKYSIDVSTAFNPYQKVFPSLHLAVNLGRYGDPLMCSVSWFKGTNPYYKDRIYDRHQINFTGGVTIRKLNLEAFTVLDFNIQERKMLYSLFSLVYHYQCLDFKADLKIFYFREKPETQFRISFGLGNIGKTTDLLGGY